jgi:hypothetical protein
LARLNREDSATTTLRLIIASVLITQFKGPVVIEDFGEARRR